MPSPRVDWQAVRQLSIAQGNQNDTHALFSLPVSGRDLLLSIVNRLEWHATYEVNDYDYADWDSLQAIVQDTINGLMGNVLMDDIIVQLDRIATALETELCCTQDELIAIKTAIEGIQVNVTCGGGGGGSTLTDWRVPEDWLLDWPTDAPNVEDNTPTTQPTGDLCDRAHSAWYELDLWFQQFADNVKGENPYAELVEELAEFQLNNVYAGWVWQLMNAGVALWYDDLLTDVAAHWASLKESFICAVVNSTNAVDLRSWVFGAIRNNPPTWSAGYYMEVLLTGTTFNGIYDETYTPFPQFIGSDCYCAELPPQPEGFILVPVVYGAPRNDMGYRVNNLTFGATSNHIVTVTYVKVETYGGAERAIDVDIAASLAAQGLNEVDNAPVGVYHVNYYTPSTQPWGIVQVGGSGAGWVAEMPYANMGKQYFTVHANYWNNAAINVWKTAVASDFGWYDQFTTSRLDSVLVGANFDTDGLTFTFGTWLIVPEP